MRIRSIEAAVMMRPSPRSSGPSACGRTRYSGTAYFDPQLDRLAEYYGAQEEPALLVAEEDSRVVGGVGIAPVAGAEGVCELQKLYVDAAYRGRGYSKALIDTALPFAAQYFDRCYL
jgi:putative acetyltransferase